MCGLDGSHQSVRQGLVLSPTLFLLVINAEFPSHAIRPWPLTNLDSQFGLPHMMNNSHKKKKLD